jgi:hypothetical protein
VKWNLLILIFLGACVTTTTPPLLPTTSQQTPDFCEVYAKLKHDEFKQILRLTNYNNNDITTKYKVVLCRPLTNRGYAIINHQAYSSDVLMWEVETITLFTTTPEKWTPINIHILWSKIDTGRIKDDKYNNEL